jgi:hypothetical protein
MPSKPAPYTAHDRYRMDGAALLGAASHLLASVADGRGSDLTVGRMAADWKAAYERFQNNERAALPWSQDFWWDGAEPCGFQIGRHDPKCSLPTGHFGIHRTEG